MFKIRNKPIEKLLNVAKEEVFYSAQIEKLEQKSIERLFVRVFSTEDGKQALAYLKFITFQRALGPTASDEHLRYLEGQRSMVASILRLIDHGRRG